MRTDIIWTDTAWEHWGAVRDRCRMISAVYGYPDLGNEHTAELLDTFARVTFAAGPVTVQKDGDGFLITTERITIGLVWTPDDDDQMRRRLAKLNDAYENVDLQSDWPRTGRWSAHS